MKIRHHARHSAMTAAAVALVLMASSNVASAQADDPDTSGVVTYPASFFDQYSPLSVNDMVTRIPGVNISGGGGGRGLGSGGNLLINGERIAGKDNDSSSQLSRISASQVDYIEIIRASSSELAVRGASQVVNVVLTGSADQSSLSAEVNMDRYADGTVDPGGSLAYGGSDGNLNYLFSVEAEPRYDRSERLEYNYYPDRTLFEIVDEVNTRDQTSLEAAVTLGYQFENDRVQFNALYGESDPPSETLRIINDMRAMPVTVRTEREHSDAERNNWEFGGDYEHSFSDNGRYQFLFVVNDDRSARTRERFQSTQAAETETKDLFLQTTRRTRERIARNTYTWDLDASQGMEIGIESAQTILDTSLLLGLDSGEAAPSEQFGGLIPVLSSSDFGSTVEEMRHEPFAIHNWTINQRMSLESTLLYEISEIEQSGMVSNSRDFAFWRPKLDYRFDVTSRFQIRATLERDVSQLSFSDFTASTDSDEDKNATAGNPDLVQEKSWRYELNLEYRLPDDIGVLSSRFFYHDMEDVIGRVDVSPDTETLLSARGNIGDGQRWGINLDSDTRLDILGLPDAVLTAGLNLSDSSITDPFLGVKRRFNGRGSTQLGFRHDLPVIQMNYGFNYNLPFDGGNESIDIDDIERHRRTDPHLTLFLEKTAFEDITFRLESMNTLDSRFCRERIRYLGPTVTGVIEEIENSCEGNGPKVALKIRTTF